MLTTSPQFPRPEPSSHTLMTTTPTVTSDIETGRTKGGEGDDRSSSLSEIEDHTANPGLESVSRVRGNESDANDTEAETERLEDSPQKIRKHTNVFLSSSNDVYHDGASSFSNGVLPPNRSPGEIDMATVYINEREPTSKGNLNGGKVDQTSEISSLEDSSEDNDKPLLPYGNLSKKRKRQSPPSRSNSDREPTATAPMGGLANPLMEVLIHLEDARKDIRSSTSALDRDRHLIADEIDLPTNDGDAPNVKPPLSARHKSKKGKRKGKKIRDEDLSNPNVSAVYPNNHNEAAEAISAVCSNGEDAEPEDPCDGNEVDVNARNEEEFTKKKSALDSLSAIENCFATLRDKLFDERLAQYNDELAMLNQPDPTHPEFLAQKEVVDRYRDEKIEYEQSLFKYKLIALQRQSIAEKAQIHAQYMQTVREIRDRNLEHLNKEWYQIQRERRSCEDSVPDYTYKFPTRRSQQITQQTAYNTEVSVLSGFAKYIGFPSAPEIVGARPSEIEEDFHNMGILTQAQPILQKQPLLRANSSTAVNFPRQRTAAEERFLDMNPWANPQHPSHHPMQRQVSGLSQPASPFITPAPQRRFVDLNITHGSASTIADPRSGPGSSVVPTPVTGEQSARSGRPVHIPMSEDVSSATPSRQLETPIPGTALDSSAQEASSVNVRAVHLNMLDHSETSPYSSNITTSIPRVSNDIAIPSSAAEGSALSAGPNVVESPRNRYPIIKAEGPAQSLRQSSGLIQHHTLDRTTAAMNGHSDVFSVS